MPKIRLPKLQQPPQPAQNMFERHEQQDLLLEQDVDNDMEQQKEEFAVRLQGLDKQLSLLQLLSDTNMPGGARLRKNMFKTINQAKRKKIDWVETLLRVERFSDENIVFTNKRFVDQDIQKTVF